MPTLAYHEGVPGHHWQISTAQELKGVRQFRKVTPFTACMEGWALYCERLAQQTRWYDNDSFGDLGRLASISSGRKRSIVAASLCRGAIDRLPNMATQHRGYN